MDINGKSKFILIVKPFLTFTTFISLSILNFKCVRPQIRSGKWAGWPVGHARPDMCSTRPGPTRAVGTARFGQAEPCPARVGHDAACLEFKKKKKLTVYSHLEGFFAIFLHITPQRFYSRWEGFLQFFFVNFAS